MYSYPFHYTPYERKSVGVGERQPVSLLGDFTNSFAASSSLRITGMMPCPQMIPIDLSAPFPLSHFPCRCMTGCQEAACIVCSENAKDAALRAIRAWQGCVLLWSSSCGQALQNLSNICIDADGLPLDFLRANRLSLVDTGVDRIWILRGHLPERVLDDDGRIVPNA